MGTIALLVAASFAAGALLFGLTGAGPPSKPAATGSPGTGCLERPLAYGLSDRSMQGRLALVERVPVPLAGFYTAATAPPADQLLHAGVHGFAVIRYRASDPAVDALRRLVTRMLRDSAVIAVPGPRPRTALTATVWGRELSCRAADARGLRVLERFVDSLHGVQ